MNDKEIKEFLLERLENRLKIYGLTRNELKGDFDLVKSGLLDSMAFVNLIGDMEERFGVEIDFESVKEDELFTTISGVIGLFVNWR
jgi:acyl carrier protein